MVEKQESIYGLMKYEKNNDRVWYFGLFKISDLIKWMDGELWPTQVSMVLVSHGLNIK